MSEIFNNLPANTSDDISNFEFLQQEVEYLPLIRLQQLTSPMVVKQEAKLGDFVLSQDVNMGKEFPAMILDHQWHAIRFDSGSITLQSYHMLTQDVVDPFSNKTVKDIVGDDNFKIISNGTDDSRRGLRHYWGPEFLILVPKQQVCGIMLLGSSSARRQGSTFRAPSVYRQPAIIYSKLVTAKNTGQSWCIPAIKPMATEAVGEFMKVLPTKEYIADTIERFKANQLRPEVIPESEIEAATTR